MAERTAQTYANHARFFPLYHFVATPLFVVNLCYALYLVAVDFSFEHLMAASTAFALVTLLFVSRVMVLTVQDRLIRLEERLRMRELLPADLQPHIEHFTIDQLAALRFAADSELPELARAVIAERLTERKAIKQRVHNWRADYQRC